jgi:hypothetical protein
LFILTIYDLVGETWPSATTRTLGAILVAATLSYLTDGGFLSIVGTRICSKRQKNLETPNAKHQQEQEDNEKRRNDSFSIRQLRGKEILMDNKGAEKKIMELVGSPVLADATLMDFSKVKVAHLTAFIKCRLLNDLTSLDTQMKMPRKGSLKEAEEDESDKPESLIRWAFNLRDHPTISIVPDAPTDNTGQISGNPQAQALLDETTYLVAVNSQREESIFEILEATEDGLQTVEELPSDDDSSMSSDTGSDDDDSDYE